MWITEEAVKAKDKSVAGHGDKRQFTLLASTAATGESLPHQVVVEGKTSRALPDLVTPTKPVYIETRAGTNTKERQKAKGSSSVCYKLNPNALSSLPSVANIGSFCCTPNHWSDDITSRDYIETIAAPYFKRKIESLRAVDGSFCQPYGTQVCVVIVDCWYGWIDPGFKNFVEQKYPWIRLIFVPASCTPVAQPMDAGIIAKLKGKLRKQYGAWAVKFTQDQLSAGIKPEEVKLPTDIPTCKKNLMEWLSSTVDQLNADKSGVAYCWEQTGLLKAWDRPVQAEASGKVKDLFPNLADTPTVDLTTSGDCGARDAGENEDSEAGELGKPFTQLTGFGEGEEDPEEWVSWIDWDKVGCAGGANA